MSDAGYTPAKIKRNNPDVLTALNPRCRWERREKLKLWKDANNTRPQMLLLHVQKKQR